MEVFTMRIKMIKFIVMKIPKVIAEIGCNHKGDMSIAKELIMTAATYCKADVVKFQKRCNKELLTRSNSRNSRCVP